jgi:hypothetical protein
LGCGVHSGKRGDSLEQLPLQRFGALAVVTCSIEIEDDGCDILHAKTRVDGLCPVKPTQQQPGGKQQDHASGHLRRYERAAQKIFRATFGVRTFSLHREGEIRSRRLERRHQTKSNPSEQRQAEGISQNVDVGTDVERHGPVACGDVGLKKSHQTRCKPPRDKRAQQSGEECNQKTFGEQMIGVKPGVNDDLG